MKGSLDVVALVLGLLLSVIATAALWLAFTGSLNWALIKVAAPFGLVVIGALGLALSRNRS